MTADGLSINPYTETPNGGWQIVSLDLTAKDIGMVGLGRDSSNTHGGQNYAEVIFFSEVPTESERAACERYLADKWGLTGSYNNWDASVFDLSGHQANIARRVEFYDSNTSSRTGAAEIVVSGYYTGVLSVPAGRTLVIAEQDAPPTAADLPQQENITGWFDPSLDGAIAYYPRSGYTDCVSNILTRTATSTDNNLVMRGRGYSTAPKVVSASRLGASGVGPVVNWMDFTAHSGSNLRTCDTSHKTIKPAIRSVFMAIDTSFGGGNPFSLDSAYQYNGCIKPRLGYDWSAPIWSPSNTVTMTHTWLDTNEVDGMTSGFNGRAEILGLEMESTHTAEAFLAYCLENRPNGKNVNYEYIGETIFYSTTLSDNERAIVQDYLMAKWLGDTQGKYTDITGATLVGAGNIRSKTLRDLPTFSANFSGNVCGGSELSFTVDSTVNAAAATDAISLSQNLVLDDACTVMVTLQNRAKAGTYTLLSAPSGSFAGKTFNLSLTDKTGKVKKAALVASETSLSLNIPATGLIIFVQ